MFFACEAPKSFNRVIQSNLHSKVKLPCLTVQYVTYCVKNADTAFEMFYS